MAMNKRIEDLPLPDLSGVRRFFGSRKAEPISGRGFEIPAEGRAMTIERFNDLLDAYLLRVIQTSAFPLGSEKRKEATAAVFAARKALVEFVENLTVERRGEA